MLRGYYILGEPQQKLFLRTGNLILIEEVFIRVFLYRGFL